MAISPQDVVDYINDYRNHPKDSPRFRKSLIDSFLTKAVVLDDRVELIFDMWEGMSKKAVVPYVASESPLTVYAQHLTKCISIRV